MKTPPRPQDAESSNSSKKTATKRRASDSTEKAAKQSKLAPTRVASWRMLQKEEFIRHFCKAHKDRWLSHDGLDRTILAELDEQILGRTAEDIDHLVNFHIKRVEKYRHSTYTPVDKWLEVMESLSDDSDALCQQLGHVMLATQQEPISEKEATVANPALPQPNYDNLYHYLACAGAKKELPPLSAIDSVVIEDCFQSLAFQIKCLNDDELRRSLRKVFIHLSKVEGVDQEDDYEEIRKNMMHNASVVNPLGINSQAIMPVPPE